MISYIKGTITHKGETFVVLECQGIGYKISVSDTTLSRLDQQQETMLYTFLYVKEDSISLFGFLTEQEQSLFERLLSVSGIGPKGALGFLSQMTPQEIVLAIVSEDIRALTKAPGVGKKTAQRLVLELKDKVKAEDALKETHLEQKQENSGAKWEAIEGLTALGYSKSEAVKAVHASYQEGLSVEEILKLALKKMVNF
ncbi:MAG TPA: Holliday junction branch migration protein RuvA [Candidatus Coprocola pullicola]|nr:Holliday junction branch migration protein RuvA [Candidatus Coprocola pullicola]